MHGSLCIKAAVAFATGVDPELLTLLKPVPRNGFLCLAGCLACARVVRSGIREGSTTPDFVYRIEASGRRRRLFTEV